MSDERGRATMPRPRVVVSQCLGFRAVRYNGAVLACDAVRRLADWVDYVEVCPEVAIGLGVPRDPIRLEACAGGPRLRQPSTGRDLTDGMRRFAAGFLEALADVDGFILKARSPSCGVDDVSVHGDVRGYGRGAGMFARAVLDRFGDRAIEDEGGLREPRARHRYLTHLFALARLRAVREAGTPSALADFHASYQPLLRAWAPSALPDLARVIQGETGRPAQDAIDAYRARFASALRRPTPAAGRGAGVARACAARACAVPVGFDLYPKELAEPME